MKKRFIVAGVVLCLFFPGLLRGQETGLLRMNPDRRASEGEAAVWGGIEDGGFHPAYGSSFQWSAGAGAHGVRHGKSTSWTGALSFEQTMGKHMYSSMFLEPGYFPIDLVEVPQGVKSRQTCRLEGGFLTDFGYEWAAGLKASVQGAHVSKRNEIRHSSFGLEAQVEPTVTYVMDDDMGLVSSYVFRLRTENLNAEPSEANQVFIDKGLRYGAYAEGIGAFPVLEFAHGFNELFRCPELSLGFGITWKRGQAGNPGQDRYRFPGSTLKAFYEQVCQADETDHVYRISYRRQRDQLRMVTGEGDGIAAASDRHGRNLNLKYEARFLKGILKSVAVDLDGNQWKERLLFFTDAVMRYDATAKLLSSFSYGPVDLDIDVLAGRGWWKDRGLDGQEAEGQPLRMTDDWHRQMDYCLVPRTGMGGTLTCRIPAVKGLYTSLYAYWYHAFNITYLPGKNREIVTLKVGYQF